MRGFELTNGRLCGHRGSANDRFSDAFTQHVFCDDIRIGKRNRSAACSVSISILSMDKISTISTPRRQQQLGVWMPQRGALTIGQVSVKRSHDRWLEIPRLAIHFEGQTHQLY